MRRLPDKLYCPLCATRLMIGKMELTARCRKCKVKYWVNVGNSGNIMLTEKSIGVGSD